jgi:hypothetical protein
MRFLVPFLLLFAAGAMAQTAATSRSSAFAQSDSAITYAAAGDEQLTALALHFYLPLQYDAVADQQLPILVGKPDALASRASGFKGFCACSCTNIRDCNTSADCGGSACLQAITCCEKPGNSSNWLARNSMCNSKKSWN